MATIRVFEEDDIPAAVGLFGRVYPEYRWTSQTACERYFRETLFDNPWRDRELPSWVAEDGGRICGYYAVVPRPMLFRGRPIRVAVASQFVVDPDQRHSLTTLRLAKAFLSGPQDLALTDGATDLGRRVWTGIGGTAPLLYSLHWIRPLRPVRYALSRLEERGRFPRPLSLAARPLGVMADGLSVRLPPNRFLREETELAEEALDPATMLAHLPKVLNGAALQPQYDARALAWLLDQTARKTRLGTLRARSVLDAERRLLGWYLYYLREGAVSEVVQLAAREDSLDRVLRALLADAWRLGAAALHGRLDPRFAKALSHRHCWLRMEAPWTLVHSRNADILAAIRQGDAFLSRLEGEWWMRFVGG